MEKTVVVSVLLAGMLSLVSCKKESSDESFGKPENTSEIQKPEDLGKEIFNGKGACIACHKPDVKLIGPSLHDIAKIYKEKNGDMITFLKGEGEPIVDPTQYEIMKTNFAITKAMSDTELKAIEAYVYSTLK
ncbi:c-type cytochrome [Flavobacterium sp.]|uniref:c-type cytochrome n=1 Tax=Flavobacterium sp. TaxID=239 RepID=UPI00286DA0F6|nr:c-type cytochrome [Flavobacterium sp.]